MVKAQCARKQLNFGQIILYSMFCFLFSQSVHAQSSPRPAYQYRFPIGKATWRTIFTAVSDQSDTSINYGYRFNADSLVDVLPGNTLNEAIRPILNKAGWDLDRCVKRQITIVPRAIPRAATEIEPPGSFTVFAFSEQEEPLHGVNISFVGLRTSATNGETNNAGFFSTKSYEKNLKVRITYAGMQEQQLILTRGDTIRVQMHPKVDGHNNRAVVVKGYGTGSQRDNTDGRTVLLSVRPIPGVTFLDAMAGRVPGLYITQISGDPQASYQVSLRGIPSLFNGPDALYIINGVPYAPGNQSISNIATGNTAGSSNPFRVIIFDSIDRIEILKGADATAIYGSRGANGVVLITGPLAKPGKITFNASAEIGFTSLAQTIRLMNTRQYLDMRYDAFRLDGGTMNSDNAKDLVHLDTTSYTDWRKGFIGNIGKSVSVGASATGGTETANFHIGMKALRENTVFITQPQHSNFNLYFNSNFKPRKGGLSLQTSVMYGNDENHEFTSDPTHQTFLPPVAPGWDKLLDAQGRPIAEYNGAPIANPFTFTRQTYSSRISNFLLNNIASYPLLPGLLRGLTLKNNSGWNIVSSNEYSQIPIDAFPSNSGATGSSNTADTKYTSLILEPQLDYNARWWDHLKVAFLGGYSYQKQTGKTTTLTAAGFTSDDSLRFQSHAPLQQLDGDSSNNKYRAVFSRLNFNFFDKYILNLTFRRDGSSRLSPAMKYGDFYALGAAWIFSDEPFVKKALPMLSFGKVRVSYGKTGNDQVGGGHFLNGWSPTTASTYQNIPGWPSHSRVESGPTWETIKKLELGIEMGFLNDRLMLSTTWYRNRSSNQLLPDSLDPTIWRNYPVVIENRGFEFTLSARLIQQSDITWDISLNWTIPVNKLVSFPDLGNTVYRNTLIVGQSIKAQKMYKYLGVDPNKGTYQILDANGDGKYTRDDLIVTGSPDVTAFGGLTTSFQYKGLHVELTFDARKKTGYSFFNEVYSVNPPGTTNTLYSNAPAWMATNRWEKPGDQATFQKVSADPDSPANKMFDLLLSSNAAKVNTSFQRLRQAYISWQLPPKWAKVVGFGKEGRGLIFFVDAQNLLTFSPYKGIAETESLIVLPPLRKIEFGLHMRI